MVLSILEVFNVSVGLPSSLALAYAFDLQNLLAFLVGVSVAQYFFLPSPLKSNQGPNFLLLSYFPLSFILPLDFLLYQIFQEQCFTVTLHLEQLLSLILLMELPSITTTPLELFLIKFALTLLSLVLPLQQWIIVEFLTFSLQQEQWSTFIQSMLRYPSQLIKTTPVLHLPRDQHKTLLPLLFFQTFLLIDQTCHLYFGTHLHLNSLADRSFLPKEHQLVSELVVDYPLRQFSLDHQK